MVTALSRTTIDIGLTAHSWYVPTGFWRGKHKYGITFPLHFINPFHYFMRGRHGFHLSSYNWQPNGTLLPPTPFQKKEHINWNSQLSLFYKRVNGDVYMWNNPWYSITQCAPVCCNLWRKSPLLQLLIMSGRDGIFLCNESVFWIKV